MKWSVSLSIILTWQLPSNRVQRLCAMRSHRLSFDSLIVHRRWPVRLAIYLVSLRPLQSLAAYRPILYNGNSDLSPWHTFLRFSQHDRRECIPKSGVNLHAYAMLSIVFRLNWAFCKRVAYILAGTKRKTIYFIGKFLKRRIRRKSIYIKLFFVIEFETTNLRVNQRR